MISGSEEETELIMAAVLRTIITMGLREATPNTWTLTRHIRLSHFGKAGRKYCSAFVTFIFIFRPRPAIMTLIPSLVCFRPDTVRGDPGLREGGGRGDARSQGDGQAHCCQSHPVHGQVSVRSSRNYNVAIISQ